MQTPMCEPCCGCSVFDNHSTCASLCCIASQQQLWMASCLSELYENPCYVFSCISDILYVYSCMGRYPARPSKASLRESIAGDALYGVAPVLAALKAGG